MPSFEPATRQQFIAAINDAPASTRFRKLLTTLDLDRLFGDWRGATYAIGHGDVTAKGKFAAPAVHAVLIGDLLVDGHVDLKSPMDEIEGGSFVVIGDVKCIAFANDYSKGTIIDGDLTATDLIVNAFEDSGLWVTRNLKTKFFYGVDIWAEVGGRAEMDYGDGYCLPIGYQHPKVERFDPRHDVKTSLRRLAFTGDGRLGPSEFLSRLEKGKPIFR